MTEYNSCFVTFIYPGRGKNNSKRQMIPHKSKSDSIPRKAQNMGINLTNLVFLSRWIAPNKAWGEYQ